MLATEPVEAAEHPADRALRVRFDRYLDPDVSGAVMVGLVSGDVGVGVDVAYDPVDRALVISPQFELRPGIGYVLTVARDGLRGFDGAVLESDLTLHFIAGLAVDPPVGAPAPVDFDDEVAPVLAARCGCHGPEPAAFPPLTPAGLINVESQRQPGRILVRPGRPLRSYLIQRVLVDYPGVRGQPKTLDDAERRLLIDWVSGLAQGP